MFGKPEQGTWGALQSLLTCKVIISGGINLQLKQNIQNNFTIYLSKARSLEVC